MRAPLGDSAESALEYGVAWRALNVKAADLEARAEVARAENVSKGELDSVEVATAEAATTAEETKAAEVGTVEEEGGNGKRRRWRCRRLDENSISVKAPP